MPSPWPVNVLMGAVENVNGERRMLVTDLHHEPVAARWPLRAEGGHYLLESAPGFEPARPLTEALAPVDEATPDHLVADPLDRLELVRLVGVLLDGLHRRELVTAGVALSCFGFGLAPRPAVVWLDGGQLRKLGDEFPRGLFEAPGSLDNDRAGFALVAYQLLVALRADEPIDVGSVGVGGRIIGLDASQERRAWRLWERAVDREGTRPTVRDWMEVLA